MTRSRPPHYDVEPTAAGDAAHNDPKTESPISSGDGGGGGTTGTGELSHHQHHLLAALTRLHHSLRGPQRLLEAAGHFSRPPFPPHPRDDSIGTSGGRS
jgi:hypothetical protein